MTNMHTLKSRCLATPRPACLGDAWSGKAVGTVQRGEGRYIFDSGEIVEKCDIEEFLKSGALDI